MFSKLCLLPTLLLPREGLIVRGGVLICDGLGEGEGDDDGDDEIGGLEEVGF